MSLDVNNTFISFHQDFSVTQRRHWNISNDGQFALTINRVLKMDEGIWECWELDSQGNVQQKAHVMKLIVTSMFTLIYVHIYMYSHLYVHINIHLN